MQTGIYGAGVDSMGAGRAAGDAGEVVTAGVDDDGGVVKIGGVAYCGRGEIPEEDFSSVATRDENGMDSLVIKCQQSIRRWGVKSKIGRTTYSSFVSPQGQPTPL